MHFWCLSGLFFGLQIGSKKNFGTYLFRQSTLVLEVQSYLFVYNSAKFWPFLHFLCLSGLFLGLGSDSQTLLLPTYIDIQPTLVLEVHPYLFVFNLATFGAFFALFWALRGYFFGPLGLIVWLGSGSKTFLEPTYVDNQLWFWKVSLIFSFLIWSNLGPFLNFLGLFCFARWGFFCGWGQVQKHFWNLLMLTINLCLGSVALSFCFESRPIWGLFPL